MRRIDDWDSFVNDMIRDFFGDSSFSGGYKRSEDADRYYKSSKDDILEDDKYIYITFELKVEDTDYENNSRYDEYVVEPGEDPEKFRMITNIGSTISGTCLMGDKVLSIGTISY